jgi:hypothetical protein
MDGRVRSSPPEHSLSHVFLLLISHQVVMVDNQSILREISRWVGEGRLLSCVKSKGIVVAGINTTNPVKTRQSMHQSAPLVQSNRSKPHGSASVRHMDIVYLTVE